MTDDLLKCLRQSCGPTMKAGHEAADEIERLRADVERLTLERDGAAADRDAEERERVLLEKERDEWKAKAGVWLNATADAKLRVEQLESDLKHVQGSDIGMMKLLHAEKLKTEAAEREVESAKVCCDSYAEENQRLFDRAEAAEQRVENLRKALKPFAEFADAWDARPLRGIDDRLYSLHGEHHFKLSDCNKARAALAETEKTNGD